jgi:hypothetical protein
MPWVNEPIQIMRPERPPEFSIPRVALVKFDLIDFEERPEFLLKRFDLMMLALVTDVGPNVLDLRLAHRERPESRLPEEARELRAVSAKPVVRAFLEPRPLRVPPM